MVLLIDNYDSFSYNLYQLIGIFDDNIKIIRNDEIMADAVAGISPDRIVISPGPGRPKDAGICIGVIRQFFDKIPILGICLGHQAIYEAFGGTVSYAHKLMHGKSSIVMTNSENPLFKGLPPKIQAARYHSLAGVKETLPQELSVIAKTIDDEIMAVCHKNYPVYGVQFHPESILTPEGQIIIKNFMQEFEYGKSY
ncbi:MAG: aminodeoxychorismate/anthranilate synthase component II [Lachnospiraceae bacterium]|nr:aminodeoxychorismate/anthranilate synthase component II [Lachnospiraceae bacterium]